MKTNLKFLIFAFIFGLALAFGVHVAFAAATVQDLQPAATIVYNEDLTVNGTGRFNSVYIGKQGVGGVTFFNGTIINITKTNGIDNPVTFGDNVRFDGEIWRIEKGGKNPLKISDTLMPTSSTYTLGTPDHKWKTGYFESLDMPGIDVNPAGDTTLQGNLHVKGVLTGGGSVVVDDDLEITPGHTLNLTGSTITGSGIINSGHIADGTIVNADIKNGTIQGAKIAVPLSLSGNVSLPDAIISATNLGNGIGVYGYSANETGVMGGSQNGSGVFANSTNSYAIWAYSVNSYGIYASSDNSYAGYFDKKIRLVPQTSAPGTCNTNEIGALYYKATSTIRELCHCNGSSWVPVDGVGNCL